MKPDNSDSQLPDLDLLKGALAAMPEIDAGFVYGSVLTPAFNAESDIDLALLAARKFSAEEKLELVGRLTEAVKREVDLVMIDNSLSLVLQDQIARRHRLIFCRNRRRTDTFLIKAPQMYFDLMYWREPMEQAYIRRKMP